MSLNRFSGRAHLATLALSAFVSTLSCSSAPKANTLSVNVEPNGQVAQSQSAEAIEEKESASLSRYVASADDEELEAKFRVLLADERPSATTSSEIRRLVAIFYRAESLLRVYDSKLNVWVKDADSINASVLNTDETYAQLLGARVLYEETIGKLGFFYTRILETMHAPAGAVTEKDRATATRMYQDIRKTILRLGRATDKLAVKSLVQELYEIRLAFFENQDAAAAGKNSSEKPAIADSVDWELTTPTRVEKFYAKNQRILDIAVSESEKDVDLQSEIDEVASTIRADLVSNFDNREPQSETVVAPGSGSSGNMSGGNFRNGRWALTFDDGPSSKYTPQVLANLSQRGLKATFFELAKNVTAQSALVKRVKAEGHALANHSYTHAQLTKLNASGLKKEIDDSSVVETKYFGFKPTLFRCPYGACGGNDSVIRKKIAAQGMVHVFWNVDSLDWQDKNAKSVYNRIKKQMSVQKRGIILVHDIHPQTVEATRMLMDDFVKGQKDGSIRTLTIPQAIKELNSGGMQ